MSKQRKWTDALGNQFMVDTKGNQFVKVVGTDDKGNPNTYWRCINPKVGEGEIDDFASEIPADATESGVVRTGRIDKPITYTDGYKNKYTIKP